MWINGGCLFRWVIARWPLTVANHKFVGSCVYPRDRLSLKHTIVVCLSVSSIRCVRVNDRVPIVVVLNVYFFVCVWLFFLLNFVYKTTGIWKLVARFGIRDLGSVVIPNAHINALANILLFGEKKTAKSNNSKDNNNDRSKNIVCALAHIELNVETLKWRKWETSEFIAVCKLNTHAHKHKHKRTELLTLYTRTLGAISGSWARSMTHTWDLTNNKLPEFDSIEKLLS